jgi:hypothetical protein
VRRCVTDALVDADVAVYHDSRLQAVA